MAKFENVQFEALGAFIREAIKDPATMEIFRHGTQNEKKDLLRGFMNPRGKTWDEIEIIAHFDEENVVNIAFPFTGDVEETVRTIAPEVGPGEDYPFPAHYKFDPNAGSTVEEKKANRLRGYRCRLGDYVMSRCR
ncbi:MULTISPECIES: hypothetical protein [unclassified Mesorhizobium]|uniref:hypothetical protein n=1 Tax=unclassified Mesorhizobium TaxID=325217 RepID=UPI00112C188F|nr:MULTISPECIES: hypothetical protein [unclassified Mesorhizobium]TPM93855.1 hypothetical protein FJ977_27045 [Mesorhizobium sp. B2-1-3A]BCG89994.1 hypothetical protein MesoLj113c_61040 [Mesorhizobium sp. 113-3-9]